MRSSCSLTVAQKFYIAHLLWHTLLRRLGCFLKYHYHHYSLYISFSHVTLCIALLRELNLDKNTAKSLFIRTLYLNAYIVCATNHIDELHNKILGLRNSLSARSKMDLWQSIYILAKINTASFHPYMCHGEILNCVILSEPLRVVISKAVSHFP